MPATSSAHKGDADEMLQAEINRRRGRFVPWIIAGFYMTFMSALIGFVVIAYQHPPNEVTPEAYEKGLAYNDTLEKSAAQAKLGWSSTVAMTNGSLSFSLQDRTGQPVAADNVNAWFVHPDKSEFDRSYPLVAISPGHYAARPALPVRGLWTVHITVQSGQRQYQTVTQVQTE